MRSGGNGDFRGRNPWHGACIPTDGGKAGGGVGAGNGADRGKELGMHGSDNKQKISYTQWGLQLLLVLAVVMALWK